MRRTTPIFLLTLLCSAALADSGVIIPSGKQSPDPAILSLHEMDVHIAIDSGHAAVSVRQVFHNRTDNIEEGTYSLALPGDAAISDFAVWDGVVRIPGVILERKRAGELYEQLRNAAIDPGLLQSGEVSESNAEGNARRTTEFSAKIVPIPAQGYKRVELEYRQTIPVQQLASSFIFPLKPVTFSPEMAEKFSVTITLRDPATLARFIVTSRAYPFKITRQTPHEIEAAFTGDGVRLSEDVAFEYQLQDDHKPSIQAFRDSSTADPGYFEASTILPAPSGSVPAKPQTVVVLLDTSLSMQWEKLERSFAALEATLRSLRPSDRFNVLVFNSRVTAVQPEPVSATPAAIAKALDFVRASTLRGGTNLQLAFNQAFAQPLDAASHVVLLSDGEMTEGVILPARFSVWFEKKWSSLAATTRPQVCILAIGDDANVRLLKRLASHGGLFEEVRSTEPLDFKLKAFVANMGLTPFENLQLTLTPRDNFDLVYRLEQNNAPGGKASWAGEYKSPGAATAAITASHEHQPPLNQTIKFTLPANDLSRQYLPRAWARARVDALLEKIDREGEDAASIAEIIRLSRKYKFVTPYTSFLAAPRSLLRPRLIRPGDPVLRVRTDSSIASVIALFPFGLTQPLRYLKTEDIWQTRFVAPPDLADGTHVVRLILRDRDGHVYREQKTFIISSRPPAVRTTLDNAHVHAGQRVQLRVRASQSTRSITASLYGVEPISLKWSAPDNANIGFLVVPANLPAGRYNIHVTAEDAAHNISRQEAPLEVIP